MLKRFLILFVVTYFTISLSTSSSFQNNNLIQQTNFDLFDNNILEIIYALHIDKDKGGNEFDIEDNNDKDDDDDDDKNGKEDDEDEKEAEKEDENDGCKDDEEGENGKDDGDDNNNESNECKNKNDNENLKLLKDQESPSTNSSTGDEFTTDSSSLPSEIDSNLIDQFNDLQDLAQVNASESSSNLTDLSNPPPFSKFQDPIPEQPGQPLHPGVIR